jgi:hypothetical protein
VSVTLSVTHTHTHTHAHTLSLSLSLSLFVRSDLVARSLSLATPQFFIVAGPRYLLDYTWGYRSKDYVPPTGDTGSVPGVPNLQSTAPEGWYRDFERAPGRPLGEAVFDEVAGTFSRNWTGVFVSINVREETAVLQWAKENPTHEPLQSEDRDQSILGAVKLDGDGVANAPRTFKTDDERTICAQYLVWRPDRVVGAKLCNAPTETVVT